MTPPNPTMPSAPPPDPAGPVGGWPDRLAARVRHRLDRWGLTTAARRDRALTAVVLVVTLALATVLLAAPEGAGGTGGVPPAVVVTVLGVLAGQALLLLARRSRPVLCLLAIAALQLVLPFVLADGDGVRLLAPLVAAYTCGARLPGGRAARVVLAATLLESTGAAVALLAAADPGTTAGAASLAVVGQVLSSLLSYGGAAVVGAHVATRRHNVALLRARATEAVRAQAARTDAAIRAERSRMARELHDIAAHHLSGMVVQAAVVERLIGRDPQAAAEAAAWVRRQGRETLHDLRLVVTALREPGADGRDDDGAPVPGLAALDRLVAAARELGTAVDLVREGRPRELPPIADVTCYRVVQEALTNVRDHAPGAAVRVLLRHEERTTRLEVVDDGGATPRPGPPPDEHRGYGLVGLQERAQLLGATFEAGPTARGGWRVALTLPAGERAVDGAAAREEVHR